jgi:hypothetical protein
MPLLLEMGENFLRARGVAGTFAVDSIKDVGHKSNEYTGGTNRSGARDKARTLAGRAQPREPIARDRRCELNLQQYAPARPYLGWLAD